MAVLLLLTIYIGFIGLGIPDSLFGPAWPVIYKEFGVSLASANYVSFVISGLTVVSSLVAPSVIARLKTAKVAALSTALTAIGLLGFAYAPNLWWFCLWGIPLGLGAGAIDTALNNYVALHYHPSQMNFLHCFYGIGVSLSPAIMSLALQSHNNWRAGYRWAFYIQAAITLIIVLSFPLWQKVHPEVKEEKATVHNHPGLMELLKQPLVLTTCLVFMGSVAIEITTGSWGSTYLVNAKNLSPELAAGLITLYYVGMAGGRFFGGIVANYWRCWTLIKLSVSLTIVAIGILFLPLPELVAGFALFLLGFGNGQLYPNLLALTPVHFGKEASQTVMGLQLAFSYGGGLLLLPILFGYIAQAFGSGLFAAYLLVLALVTLFSMLALIYLLKQAGIKQQ